MRKVRFRFYLLGIASLSVILIAAFYLAFGRIAVYFFSTAHNLSISYDELRQGGFRELVFEDLAVTDKGTGMGFVAKHAAVKPIADIIMGRNALIDLAFRDGRFIKNKPEELTAYDSLPGLVSMPFQGSWTYKEISAKIQSVKDGVEIKKLEALSDDIRLSVKGLIYTNGTVASDITIYFSDKLTKKIPEDFAKVMLRDEEGGWKSLSVNLRGDYKRPAIQVSGKLFRLNIKSVN